MQQSGPSREDKRMWTGTLVSSVLVTADLPLPYAVFGSSSICTVPNSVSVISLPCVGRPT